jgi:hypothetical protein
MAINLYYPKQLQLGAMTKIWSKNFIRNVKAKKVFYSLATWAAVAERCDLKAIHGTPPYWDADHPLANQHTNGQPAHQLPPATGGHQHHQTPAPNLPRRHRQTGQDTKGVTPELLRLKFYCSWTRDFFLFFFFSLRVCLSCMLFDCPLSLPVDFLGSPFFSSFSLSFSSSFFSFFLGFVNFIIVS